MPDELEKAMHHELTANPALNKDVAFLVVVLKKYNFFIMFANQGHKNKYTEHAWNAPYIWIDSPSTLERYTKLGKLKGKERDDLYTKFSLANVRDRAKLFTLLDDFYTTRTPPFYARLIVEAKAVGSSLLTCQGKDVMALPKNKIKREQWLKDSWAEMRNFAEFLWIMKV